MNDDIAKFTPNDLDLLFQGNNWNINISETELAQRVKYLAFIATF